MSASSTKKRKENIMAKRTNRVVSGKRGKTADPIIESATAFIESQILPLGSLDTFDSSEIVGFDSDDLSKIESIKTDDHCMNPVHEIARAATALDPSNVWKVSDKSADGEFFTDRIRKRVKGDDGEWIRNADGKIKTKSETVKLNGIMRTKTLKFKVGK